VPEEYERLWSVREWVAKRIEELEREVEALKALLELLDQRLKPTLEYKPADRFLELGKLLEEREIKSRESGKVLARAKIYERGFVVDFVEPVDPNEAAFRRFLKEKVLEKYRKADEEAVEKGELEQKDKFSYELELGEGGKAVRLKVLNYREEERLVDLLRAIRWTLEKAQR